MSKLINPVGLSSYINQERTNSVGVIIKINGLTSYTNAFPRKRTYPPSCQRSSSSCQLIQPLSISQEKSGDDGKEAGSGHGADLGGTSLEWRRLDSGRARQSTATSSCWKWTSGWTSCACWAWLGAILPHKVSTVDARLVGEMDDNRAIAEESANTLLSGKILVDVRLLEAGGLDLAVFSAVVADLAGFWLGLVAGGVFAADEGVEMGEGLGAVAIFGDRLVVDMISERAFSLEETAEVDVEFDALAAGSSDTTDGTTHFGGVFVEKLSFVDNSQRVSFCLESVSKLASFGGSIAQAQK